MPKRPHIGISRPDKKFHLGWLFISLSVWLAGGRPVALTPRSYTKKLSSIFGIVIAGGTDIHPDRYGIPAKPDYTYDLDRDEMEATLIAHAEKHKLPLLGVCRGAQLINVIRGGTLHMNVALAYEKAEYPNGTLARIFFRKPMQTVAGSLIARLVKCDDCSVNSMHTQSIDKLGKGLTITAKEPNGVVQAIEDKAYPYWLGVQFHPEYMQHRAQDRRIFAALVEEAAARE